MGKKSRLKKLRAQQEQSSGCPFCGADLDVHHSTKPDYKKYYVCGTPYNLICRGIICRLNSLEDSVMYLTNVIEQIASPEIIENAKTKQKEEEAENMPVVPMPRVLRKSS